MVERTELEKQIIEIIATDRIDIPISSISGKLKRTKPKLAKALNISPGESFEGERVYARAEAMNVERARRLSEAVDDYCKDYNREGKILQGYIAEKRVEAEVNLYFGVNSGSRLTAGDYLGVMKNLGFSEGTARSLYPELMDVSRKLSRKRDEGERSILIG